MNLGHQRSKFIAADAGKQIERAQLALHSPRNLLQIPVAHLVAVDIVHLLELIEIDIDQSKDAPLAPGLLNMRIQLAIEREAIQNVRQRVQLRSPQQVRVDAPRLDGNRGKRRSSRQGLHLDLARLREGVKGRIDLSQR